MQGYCPVLDMNIRWEWGELVVYDPSTGRPLATLADECARANAAGAELAALRDHLRRLQE